MELCHEPEEEFQVLDQGSQVPVGDLHLPQDLRELHEEAQEVVRPVQVGGRRELVLQGVVVWRELPAQHLVELVVPAALQAVEGSTPLSARRGGQRGRRAAVHWRLSVKVEDELRLRRRIDETTFELRRRCGAATAPTASFSWPLSSGGVAGGASQ